MAQTFTLSIPTLEENPVHKINNFLTVGSEHGDVIINDPSIDAKHCSFIVNDDVISLIDHDSGIGTFIDDERIPSGKMIILLDGDKIKIGEIAVEVQADDGDTSGNSLLYQLSKSGADSSKSIDQLFVDQIIGESGPEEKAAIEKTQPDVSEAASIQVKEQEDDITQDNIVIPKEFYQEEEPEKKKGLFDFLKPNRGVKIKRVEVVGNVSHVTEVIFRMLSFSLELVMAYIFYLSFLKTDFASLYLQVNTSLISIAKEFEIPMIDILVQDFGVVVSVYVTYAAIRVFSSLIFSVSYMQLILGFKSSVDGSRGKTKAFVRESLGVVMAPFLLGDLMIFSKGRSLKEMLSGSRIFLANQTSAMSKSFILIPLVLIIFIFSPLLENGEVVEGVPIKELNLPKIKGAGGQGFEASLYFQLRVDNQLENEYLLVPMFKMKGESLTSYIKAYSKKDNTFFKLFSIDSSRISKVIQTFAEEDLLFAQNYPMLAVAFSSNNFENPSLGVELKEIYQQAFALSVDNVFEHMLSKGPYIGPYMNLRNNLAKELGADIVDGLIFVNSLGNNMIRLDTHVPRKAFQIFYIPLVASPKSASMIEIVAPYKESIALSDHVILNLKKLPKLNKKDYSPNLNSAFGVIDYIQYKLKGEIEASTELVDFYIQLIDKAPLVNASFISDFEKSIVNVQEALSRHMKKNKNKKLYKTQRIIDSLGNLVDQR